MTVASLTQMQQSASAAGLPGSWKLGTGRAITLQPREAGVLKIAHGRVWATFDGPHSGFRNDLGDYVLGVGERLPLRAGQRLVMEAWSAPSPVYFTWEPMAQEASDKASPWSPVLQPLADLRQALLMAGGAAGRLLGALAGLAWGVLAGHDRARPVATFGAAGASGHRPDVWRDAGRAALWATSR